MRAAYHELPLPRLKWLLGIDLTPATFAFVLGSYIGNIIQHDQIDQFRIAYTKHRLRQS